MPRDDFDVITGPTAPSRPTPPASLPPASLPPAPLPLPAATPAPPSHQQSSDLPVLQAPR
jgi:hypothetical protein